MDNVSWLGEKEADPTLQFLTIEFDDVDASRLNRLLSIFHRDGGGTGLHIRKAEVSELLANLIPIITNLQHIEKIGADAAAGPRQEL